MEQVKKQYRRKGISLKLVSWIISAFVLIISSTLVASLALISYENQKVNESNAQYTIVQAASNDVQAASDYLTDQVRLFVANAEKRFMDAYFVEANVTKRRDNALDTIHRFAKDTKRHEEIHDNITAAVNESNDLMNLEFYAMKLICVDVTISYDEYPKVDGADISGVAPEDYRSEALKAVFGSQYLAQKEKISYHVDKAVSIISELIEENGKKSADSLSRLIILQSVVIGVNVAFALGVVLILLFLIVKPMDIAFHAIESNKEVRTYGNREFNYIVDAYNDVRSQNEKVKEKLTYEAEHDKLTNLYNRTGYVSLFRRMRLERTLYILIDVDGFKEINDQYGHDIGDKVLIRIATQLDKSFSEDNAFVFRIGGDEFAVLIENIDDETNNTIIDRCEKIIEELSVSKGRIPPTTLSIGIARGVDDDSTDTLFKKADTALYKVKQSGKSGVLYEQNK